MKAISMQGEIFPSIWCLDLFHSQKCWSEKSYDLTVWGDKVFGDCLSLLWFLNSYFNSSIIFWNLSGLPSGLRRQTQVQTCLTLIDIECEFWSSTEGVGSNATPDILQTAACIRVYAHRVANGENVVVEYSTLYVITKVNNSNNDERGIN